MAFPTIPTAAASRILGNYQANATATRTFPDLSGLTKDAGDLLIAVVWVYQSASPAVANAIFSGWTGGFTEFVDQGGGITTNGAIGCAYKWSTGSESGTFAVTQAAAITGHASMIVMSIAGVHDSTPPEGGAIAVGTTAADPVAFDPGGWGAEDTLWIAVAGIGETSTGGAWTGIASAPANYGDYFDTGLSGDTIGAVEGAVAFRQLNAASEDVGGFTLDTSNARNSALILAVRPVFVPEIIPELIMAPMQAY